MVRDTRRDTVRRNYRDRNNYPRCPARRVIPRRIRVAPSSRPPRRRPPDALVSRAPLPACRPPVRRGPEVPAVRDSVRRKSDDDDDRARDTRWPKPASTARGTIRRSVKAEETDSEIYKFEISPRNNTI